MDKEEILLKEYEICQSNNNALGNQSWISFSIIITVNLILLGQIIPDMLLKSPCDTRVFTYISVIILGLVMIYILLLFKRWDERVTFHMRLNHLRMREIEGDIESAKGTWILQKNWRVRSLDIEYGKDKEKIPETFKTILEDLKKRFPKQPKGADKELLQTKYVSTVMKGFLRFDLIFCVLIALWAISVLYALGLLIFK